MSLVFKDTKAILPEQDLSDRNSTDKTLADATVLCLSVAAMKQKLFAVVLRTSTGIESWGSFSTLGRAIQVARKASRFEVQQKGKVVVRGPKIEIDFLNGEVTKRLEF